MVEIPGGSKKKDSLPILGLQRLASLNNVYFNFTLLI